MVDTPATPHRRDPARPAGRSLFFALLTAASAAVGYETFDPRLQIALVWPVLGVATLWLLSGSRRTRPWDVLLLALVTLLALLVEHADWRTAAMGTLQVVVGALVWVWSAARLTGGRPQLRRPLGLEQVAVVVAASLLSATVLAVLRLTGAGLLPPTSWGTAGLLVVRNTSGLLVTVVIGLLVAHWLHRRATTPDQTVLSPRVLLEFGALLGMATGIAYLVFSGAPVPLSFALVLLVVLAAFRVRPLGAVLIGSVVGVVAVVATIEGRGTFVLAGNGLTSAAIAQGFLVTVVVAALLISIGVDERERALQRARAAEAEAEGRAELVERVIANITDGISVISAGGQYLVRNPASYELSGPGGFRDPEVDDPGQPVIRDLAGEPVPPERMPWRRVLAGEDPARETFRVRYDDGRERVLRVVAHRTEIGLPEPAVTTSVHDVTQETEERDQLVSFAGVVAHDLKNPLTVIRGWSESLQEELRADGPPDVPALRAMVARVVSASDSMRGFIDDLLGITVARDRRLEVEQLDLSSLAEQVAELRRGTDGLPRIWVQHGLAARGDRFLVRQLLDNLVGNAVKYVAPEVRPTVTVTGVEVDGMLEVSVADNGIGIPPGERERVFQPLVRAEAGGSYAGTGLGLAICRRVVERHGGRIWVDPEVREGTVVRFTLPLAFP